MFVHNIDPVLFQIGSFQIRYYGVFFVLGILIVYFFLKYLAKKRDIGLKSEDVDDYMLYLLIGMIIGARFFHVFVYNPGYYLANPELIPAIWKGGISFHGGFLGAFLGGYIFARKKKIHPLDLADLTAIPVGLSLMLVRIGNFINAELIGRVTSLPWGVKFPDAAGFRHPSQLYEAGKNLLTFIVLFSLKDMKLPRGALFFLWVIMYSILRFIVEFVREPREYGLIFGFLSFGQILNIIMLGIALIFMYIIYKKPSSKNGDAHNREIISQ